MSYNKADNDATTALPRLPEQPGEPFRLWRMKIKWRFSATQDDRQQLFAARVVAECLPESAAQLFSEVDPATYRNKAGLDAVLNVLSKTYSQLPEIELAQVASRFFRLTRNSGESNSQFATRFQSCDHLRTSS